MLGLFPGTSTEKPEFLHGSAQRSLALSSLLVPPGGPPESQPKDSIWLSPRFPPWRAPDFSAHCRLGLLEPLYSPDPPGSPTALPWFPGDEPEGAWLQVAEEGSSDISHCFI